MSNSIENKVTVDTIIDYLQEKVEKREVVDSAIWMDAARKMNVLLGEEQAGLFRMEQAVAKLKLQFINGQDKVNVSEAKARVEASDEYRDMKTQKAKIDRVIEFIRLAKLNARIANDEWINQ